MTPRGQVPQAVFFDLDGTLIDSAADLAQAANTMRSKRGLSLLALERFRPRTSAGARGMLEVAFEEFGILVTDENTNPSGPFGDFLSLREEFFANYASALVQHTSVFEGVEPMLRALSQRGVAWGVVTNKSRRFTEPLLRALVTAGRLPGDAVAVVSGDTTPHFKPHPEPLLHAARAAQVQARRCWYVGDDLRDMQAGRAAGMRTLAVRWGYGEERAIASWGADDIVDSPQSLLQLLPRV